MGLRDFMLGVEQFKSGMGDIAKMRDAEAKSQEEQKVADFVRQKF